MRWVQQRPQMIFWENSGAGIAYQNCPNWDKGLVIGYWLLWGRDITLGKAAPSCGGQLRGSCESPSALVINGFRGWVAHHSIHYSNVSGPLESLYSFYFCKNLMCNIVRIVSFHQLLISLSKTKEKSSIWRAKLKGRQLEIHFQWTLS